MDEKPPSDQDCNRSPCTTTPTAIVTPEMTTVTSPLTMTTERDQSSATTVVNRASVNPGLANSISRLADPPRGQSNQKSSDANVVETAKSFQTTTMSSLEPSRSDPVIDYNAASLTSESITTDSDQIPPTSSKSPTNFRWMALFWNEVSEDLSHFKVFNYTRYRSLLFDMISTDYGFIKSS